MLIMLNFIALWQQYDFKDTNSPSLYLSYHSHESLLYIDGIFSTCFQEWNTNFICKCLEKPEKREPNKNEQN